MSALDPSSPADVGDDHLWSKVESGSARRVLWAALESFSERGYHATTTRQISQRADLSPTAMYAHYGAKMDLLVLMSEIGHAAVVDEISAAAAAGVDTVDSVRRFVHTFAAWHARNHVLGRVVQYEMRTIPVERSDRIRGLRRDITRRLRELLERGVAESVFAIDDLGVTTISILSLGIDIARWYDGRPDAEDLATAHTDLVMRMIGAPELVSAPAGQEEANGRRT
jgi:AcrR family transcriptional regulator